MGVKEYEIDKRTVVIQRNRVVKCRPLVRDWKAKFTVIFDDEILADGNTQLLPLFEEAGRRVGILDFRPVSLL